jgi:hypothetical protein
LWGTQAHNHIRHGRRNRPAEETESSEQWVAEDGSRHHTDNYSPCWSHSPRQPDSNILIICSSPCSLLVLYTLPHFKCFLVNSQDLLAALFLWYTWHGKAAAQTIPIVCFLYYHTANLVCSTIKPALRELLKITVQRIISFFSIVITDLFFLFICTTTNLKHYSQ